MYVVAFTLLFSLNVFGSPAAPIITHPLKFTCEVLFRAAFNIESTSNYYLKPGDYVKSVQFANARFNLNKDNKSVNRELVYVIKSEEFEPKKIKFYDVDMNVVRRESIDATDYRRSNDVFLVADIDAYASEMGPHHKDSKVKFGQKVYALRGVLRENGTWEETGELIAFVIGPYFSMASLTSYEIISTEAAHE